MYHQKRMLELWNMEVRGCIVIPRLANWYLLSNLRSLVYQIQLTRGKHILKWHEFSISIISIRWWHISEAFVYFCSPDRLKDWWRNLKSWRPKQQTSFFENSREAHSCQHTAEHLKGHTKTHWHTHRTFFTVHPHMLTKTHTSLSVFGHPLGSPVCRSFYMGNIIVLQLCPSLQHYA